MRIRGVLAKAGIKGALLAYWPWGSRAEAQRERSLGAPLPKGFWELTEPGERALAARAHGPAQAYFWRCAAQALAAPFESSRSVFWLKSERPRWRESEPEWRQARLRIAQSAAELGWIDPKSRLAHTIGRPERRESLEMLGGLFDQPWPAQARYCDTLAVMCERLFKSDLGARLCGLSDAGLSRARLLSDGFSGIAKGEARRAKRL